MVTCYCYSEQRSLLQWAGSMLTFTVEQIHTDSLEDTEHHLNSANFLKLHIHCTSLLFGITFVSSCFLFILFTYSTCMIKNK